jgi:hypothetical protein
MRGHRATASLAVMLGVTGWLAPAIARANPAAAEALFREGRRLLDEGKTSEACVKLAESQAQDPSSGTLLNLGLCHEMEHKLATAWSEYVSAARLAREQGRPDRAAVAEKRASALEPRLPHLTVIAQGPAAGLEIARNGERLGSGLLGSAVPVDPGSYGVTAGAPGHRTWTTTIELAEGESKTVQVPALEPEALPATELPVLPSPVQPSPPPVPPVTPLVGPRPAPTSAGGPLGWIVGGAGVAALAVGAGFGLASLASYDDASSLCRSRSNCSPEAVSARNSAESKAWVSNVALGIGFVGVGLGGWILLSGARGAPATRVAVGGAPDTGGIRISVERGF